MPVRCSDYFLRVADINHAIVNEDGGLRLAMNIVDRAKDSVEISNRCLSDIITEEQAFLVIERWSLMHLFERGLDQEADERAEARYRM